MKRRREKEPFRKSPPRPEPQELKTIVFYKPFGVLSQFTAEAGHKSLGDFGFPPEVYPVGRLDHDSEGLLVLTNDLRLKHRMGEARYKHPRTYLAQVEGIPMQESLQRLSRGLRLNDGNTRPCDVRVMKDEPDGLPPRNPPIRVRKNIPTTWLELTLTEGRNRQVRRMTAAVGHPTLRLLRVRFGTLDLAGLEPGQWRLAGLREIRDMF